MTVLETGKKVALIFIAGGVSALVAYTGGLPATPTIVIGTGILKIIADAIGSLKK